MHWTSISSFVVAAIMVASTASAGLREKLEVELKRGDRVLESSTRDLANRYQYVFVGGFLNEFIRRAYFTDNVASLNKDFGVHSVTVIQQSSKKSVEVNAASLSLKLSQLYVANKRPIVLIGHSKGAAESLELVLRDPRWLEDGRIFRVVLIQGALGGSPVADFLISRDCAPEGDIKYLSCTPGLVSLGTAQSRARLSRGLQNLTPDQRSIFIQKVALIRTAQNFSSELSVELFPTYSALKHKGPNDGLVLLADQSIPGFELDMAVLDADHADLVTSWKFANLTTATRRAFTRALIQEIILSE